MRSVTSARIPSDAVGARRERVRRDAAVVLHDLERFGEDVDGVAGERAADEDARRSRSPLRRSRLSPTQSASKGTTSVAARSAIRFSNGVERIVGRPDDDDDDVLRREARRGGGVGALSSVTSRT